ncbi:TonB-dependent receptor plug domain-containing protein [Luteimonas notoginsengisoli]|uniref:TonB-dependent receptor plug domain-containing protein n=1 Tax=Luteimonas notoginsengisoli TaxID=1578200 RepID=A0ABV7UTD8_9GAMM
MTLQTHKLRDAIAVALVAGATGVAGSGAAFAQDQNQDTSADDATTLDRIEVTGSRLKRSEIEGALPVTVIDRAQIDASGEVSVSDYLRTTNFNSVGQFRPQSGSSAQAGAFADLRGLGSQRTLVLIDGHRAPKAPFAAGAGTDLNAIPLAAVERIEVLTDGASAVYGADAVGGVINLILRKDYNGAQVTIGKSSPKWGPTDEASILFGVSGDRGHIVGGFSHNRRAMIFTNTRPWGSEPGASTFGNNYFSVDADGNIVNSNFVNGIDFYNPVEGGCTNEDFYISPINGRCVYDFNATAADEASYGNKAFFLNGEVQINDDWSTYLSTTVTNAGSFGRYAPVPGVVVIAPDAAQNPVPGATTYLYHRFAAAGNRDTETNANAYDILLGFRGTVGDTVDVDVGVRYNTYRYDEFGRNFIVGSLAEQAINDGRYNIYDPGATPVDVLNSIKATTTRNSVFTTKEAFGNITFNDVFEMGGGSAGLVVGGEFRKEDYADIFDSLSSAGVILGSSGASSGGGREVSSIYAEMLLPFTSTLEADIAGRYEKYSDYGSNFAPKVALRWHPIDSLTLRGSVGRGFVAPTLDIITQETAFSADSVFDPATCLFFGADTAEDCAAFGGDDPVQVNAFREKAEGLGAEESSQYSLGVVWDATDWLNVTVDYWNIKIEERIAFFSSQQLINIDNGDDSTPMPGAPCSLTRDPNRGNAVVEVHNCFFNQGEVKTDGLDLTLRTNFDLAGAGRLTNVLQASWSHEFTIDGGADQVQSQGFPAVRATLNNQWQRGDWGVGYIARYIGSNGSGASATESYLTHDLQASVELPWNAKFTVGVNNVGDKMPELISFNGRPFNFFLYDAYGRTPYVRYEQRF